MAISGFGGLARQSHRSLEGKYLFSAPWKHARLDLERNLRFGWGHVRLGELASGNRGNRLSQYSFRQQPPVSSRLSVRWVARGPLCRTLRCFRPSERSATALEPGRSEPGPRKSPA